MPKTILVLNPNSSTEVTARMQKGCEALLLPDDQVLSFATLPNGPTGIESQRHVESVVIPTCDYCLSHDADAYVIGCFSDPGLYLLREETERPVFGIGESALQAALARGGRFAIVSINTSSIPRHQRAVRSLGISDQFVGDRALDLGVTELLDRARAIERIIEVGSALRDEDGAKVLILGCSGMGTYRSEVEATLNIPVIDPTQAAVMHASHRLL